ncbi:hypothetical protein LSG25_03910 [Paralcaligenes sp. KSB-10]|nr:hypothetical protein [Paralcaligenes sp. KSB-10]UHL65057.1 hypothetical protein LSG25_03910 [Paralcaligenes sp. KSB-10]
MADNKPKFSAGLVVAVITLVFAVVFGSVVVHGEHMITKQESGSRS